MQIIWYKTLKPSQTILESKNSHSLKTFYELHFRWVYEDDGPL